MQLLKNKTWYVLLLCAAAFFVPLATLTAQPTDTASVTVRLRDHVTGAALVGEVGLALQTAQGVVLKHATANEQGEAVFKDLPTGAVHLSTKHEAYAVEHAGFRLNASEAHQVELELSRAVHVRGSVLDPNGAPLVGAQVKAIYETPHDSFANSYQWETGDARSDEQGSFELAVHPTRDFVIVAVQKGYLSEFTAPLRANIAPVLLQLTRGVRVTGEVRDASGNPLAGAQVQLGDSEDRRVLERFLPFELLQQRQQFTVTAADGSFAFNEVRPARKSLVITHPQYTPNKQTLELGLRRSQVEARITLQK